MGSIRPVATALNDGRHDLELHQAQVPALGLAPGGAMLTEDVGDLQGGPPLHLQLQPTYWVSGGGGGVSRGLITLRSRSVATWA